MTDTNLEDLRHRELDEHRRSTVYVAGLGLALLIVVIAGTAAILLISQIVHS